ncbi:sigma factor-like helix-turn-helix DNA-binding protein [Tepidimicrobium xylanilyticum]|uniref:Sigma-70, region 4 n=1 Tax=Tepidimicrobium xylanilyticum TaxID=1123352 RepID=A0A1H3F2X8_9FIRM|nr:sigma factor-like helix-turn-helix DNA-binding protein [Tepidimicrobium xylanilyticum]SDX85240.1 Sigma-70, region 4 [Tepidimicrobium xylanilyticum]
MDTIKSYKDLCSEIEIWKERLKTYEIQIEAIKKLAKLDGPKHITGIDYTQPYVDGTRQIGFEEALEMLHKIESHIYLHKEAIANMEKSKKKIEEEIKKLERLDKKVVYMRDIEGKTLKEIADELGYSEIYIKKISARNKRVY